MSIELELVFSNKSEIYAQHAELTGKGTIIVFIKKVLFIRFVTYCFVETIIKDILDWTLQECDDPHKWIVCEI